VILTGGDPLMMAPRRLAELIAALDAIAHVAVVRIHSRVPIVDPGGVTDDLVAALKPTRAGCGWASIAIIARELAPPGRAALGGCRCRHTAAWADGAAGRASTTTSIP
jgi:lysine 2,3-aminomutase